MLRDRISLWVILILACIQLSRSATSRRAKCAVECYIKCVNSGTPNGAYCACSPPVVYRSCNAINESLIKAETIDDVLPVKTEYLDAHTIHITMSANPEAFIYIFEFSTVSTSPDDWMFAGTSVTPEIIFTIPDPCRDYQFRVIAVLRSTNPMHQLAVFRPRAIQVTLPDFVVNTEQMEPQHPVHNAANRTVTVYVQWKNPRGYMDSDVYGYEGAAVYPIQCFSPEDQLPTPAVELMKGGGRLRVTLPVEMLEGKCRLWVEVRMLPRCVRLEPFSIQQSLELDCEKLPTLAICKHEISPQCTDIIDVWGSNGNVTVMWAPPTNFGDPLYYHVKYGAAQMQGVPPFVSWTIASRHEMKTPGNTTSLNVLVDEDVDYGVQVCAVYNEQRRKPKFGLVRVIPFICTSCKTVPVEAFGRCGECTKIEGPLLFQRRCHPSGGIGCATHSWNPTESGLLNSSSFGPPIDIQPTHKENISIIDSAAPKIPHSEIFTMNSSELLPPPTEEATTTTTLITDTSTTELATTQSTDISSPQTISTEDQTAETSSSSSEDTHPDETTTFEFSSETTMDTTSAETNVTSDLDMATVTIPTETATDEVTTTDESPVTTDSITTSTAELSSDTTTDGTTSVDVQEETPGVTSISSDLAHLSTVSSHRPAPPDVQTTFSTVTTPEPETTMTLSHTKAVALAALINAVKDAQQVKKPSADDYSCELLNGVLCQFGCESNEKCVCPESSHIMSSNGGCVEKTIGSTASMCSAKRDVNATWDAKLRALHIYSQEVYNEVKQKNSVDKVYIEFGRVKEAKMTIGKPSQNVHLNGYVFDASLGQRSRMVIRKDKILRHGLFWSAPFLFYVNQSVDPLMHMYGLRICSYNSSTVKRPFQKDWDRESDLSTGVERNSNVVQVLQLSPIKFVAGLVAPVVISENGHFTRLLSIIAPLILIAVLVTLIFALLYLNCSRIRRFYDRRRSRYVRHYVVNGGATTIGPYVSRGTDTSQQRSLYVGKTPYVFTGANF